VCCINEKWVFEIFLDSERYLYVVGMRVQSCNHLPVEVVSDIDRLDVRDAAKCDEAIVNHFRNSLQSLPCHFFNEAGPFNQDYYYRLRTIRGRRRQHGKVNDTDRREEFIDWFFDRGERLRRAIDSLADEVQAEINA
jgi:hypothetical protein